MTRHVHADLIHAWAEGAEIELMGNNGEWIYIGGSLAWVPEHEYRIKPKEPEWWKNIPEHGVLVDFMGLICTVSKDEINSGDINPEECIPLTNEEIERFKR